jgi:predicted methyltransferase
MDRRINMRRLSLIVSVALVAVATLAAQQPDAAQIRQERQQAELDVPKLVEILGLKPGMTIADVGAGGGAFTVVLGKWIGSGTVYATDIGQRQLREIRDYADREGLKNVKVIEGAAAATNLPLECCDAIFMRDVYHHVTTPSIAAFNKSVFASLKPGGRFAVIDFRGRPGSAVPEGVPANRGGHGIPPEIVVDEVTAAGFKYQQTIEGWPDGSKARDSMFLVLFQK